MASLSSVRAVYQKPARSLDNLGEELRFYVTALAWTPRAIARYKQEILRILAEVALGSGALAVIGGTVGVITAMCFFTGTEVGLQGYAALNQVARLGSECRVFAPTYRQGTLGSLTSRITGVGGAQPDPNMAYGDVLDAWKQYRAHDNQGRGVGVVGHP